LSDSFDVSLSKVNLSKYLDELQEEIARVLKDVGPGKSEGEIEAGKKRIEDVLRRQAVRLAKETGVAGNYVFIYSLMSSVLTTALTAFTIKRGLYDTTRSFEERLRLEELLSSLPLALATVVSKSAEHADMYGKK
jgi:hypothetical protein